uniref:High-affinity branched-chain amino acid transporter, ATP-binding protein n=1 Tax=Comamonas testosteroni TaxID=285 RepID=G9C9E4_COMTE|nr:ABC transporter ATP-binding protein [Comamonas testosteroni]AEX00409.1 high-affinity branched-chain amino acid transporter, ATP-binding protein [Comamonas testosteroni]
MIAPALLTCKGVHAGYGGSQVLNGIDLEIRPGEVVTLLGRNGMGKSTLVKTLVGLLAASAGDVEFCGTSTAKLGPDSIARLGMAVVPEGRRIFGNLSVDEHLIAFAANGAGNTNPWTRARLYQLFPRLQERSNHLGGQLSGGEQQMLAIARALSTNPRLLILDEATEGLAPVIRDEIWKCLKQLRQEGQTILVIDKYVEALLGFADHHVILERGQVAWKGDSVALDSDRGLWQRYLGV